MPEETGIEGTTGKSVGTKPTTVTGIGFDQPVADPGEGKLPEHIHPETLMAKGVDPDTKEVVSINLAAMQAKHGEKNGKDLYTKIAKAGGFFDPGTEPVGSVYFPDLSLEGMEPKARAAVDAILKGAN